MRTREEIEAFFAGNDWQEFPPTRLDECERLWAKRFDGVQVMGKLYDFRRYDTPHVSVEFLINEEPIEGQGWVKFILYGEDLIADADRQIARLLRAYRAMQEREE